MSSDRTVIITGPKDSGLGCVAQIVEKLGIPVLGGKQPDPTSPVRKKIRVLLNKRYPRGAYICRETLQGIKDPESLKGNAVKMYPVSLLKSEKTDAKIILCVRDPRLLRETRLKYHRNVPLRALTIGYEIFARWIMSNPLPVHVVDHEELKNNPKEEVRKIADFIGAAETTEAENVVSTENIRNPGESQESIPEEVIQVYLKAKNKNFGDIR